MKISSIHTNSMAFKAKKKKDDSEAEEVAVLGGGALGGTAVHKLSQINKVAAKTGGTVKEVGNIFNKVPKEAKVYQEGLLMSLRRFLKTIHLERLVGKGAGRVFGVIGGFVSGATAIFGITEAAGAYSGLIAKDKN